MVKLTVRRHHRIPHIYDFASLREGEIFVKKDTDSNRILFKETKEHYSDLGDLTLFKADPQMQCYIVEELEIQYSLKYE